MTHILSLNRLRRGETAEIFEVTGSARDVQRLHEMGICLGCKVEVVQQGCPCIVRLRGAKYCLRGDDCQCVLVSLCNDDETAKEFDEECK